MSAELRRWMLQTSSGPAPAGSHGGGDGGGVGVQGEATRREEALECAARRKMAPARVLRLEDSTPAGSFVA